MKNISIREAEIEDSQIILKFIKDLASYEKAEHEVTAEVEDIQESIFGTDSTVKALICCKQDVPIGYAVYFYNYSTWQGRKGLYLEDLYIMPEHQGDGAGYQLLKHLAQKAVSENCGRFEWSVLDWNEPAIGFYKSIGAEPQDEWVAYRLTGKALVDLAEK